MPRKKKVEKEALEHAVPRDIEPGYYEKAEGTLDVYLKKKQRYLKWCRRTKCEAADEQTILRFFKTELKRCRSRTLEGYLAALRSTGPKEPMNVLRYIRSLKKKEGSALPRVIPVTLEQVLRMAKACPNTPAGWRDRAIILTGFAGGLRPYDLIWLRGDDVSFKQDDIMTVHRRRTERGIGQHLVPVKIPAAQDAIVCPVRAMMHWLQIAPISAGAVFRSINRHGTISKERLSARTITDIVRRSAERAGNDDLGLTGESLAAGFAVVHAHQGILMHME